MMAAWATSLPNMRRVVDGKRAVDKAGVHARLGETLLAIQVFEDSLRMVLTFVIQKPDTPLTMENLTTQQETERTKTIGYFLAQLRRRIAIHPDVDATLTAFLRMRNTFAHDLRSVEGWDLATPAGLSVANDFISDVQARAYWLHFWLAGIIRDWSEQVGLTTEFDDDEVMRFIDRTFRPFAVWSIDEPPE